MKVTLSNPQTPPPAPCALQQHPAYGRAIASLGAFVQVATIHQHENLIAQAQIVTRRFGPLKVAWLPRGPVWAPHVSDCQKCDALSVLPTAVKRPVQWLATPDSDTDSKYFTSRGFASVVTPQFMAEIDLKLPTADRLAKQHGKWRNRLRQAQNSSLQVTCRLFDPAQDQNLLVQEMSQRRIRGYRALPYVFNLAWARNDPESAQMFIAQQDNEISAFMLILLHHPVATYHIGWTGPQGRRISAHNLLWWSASNWLSRNGYVRFDLGQVDTQNSPGLARFKIGSGADVRPLGSTLVRLPLTGLRGFRQHAAA